MYFVQGDCQGEGSSEKKKNCRWSLIFNNLSRSQKEKCCPGDGSPLTGIFNLTLKLTFAQVV